jgi:hypothetical protein
MKIETVGLDIAKQIFQAHGVDRTGKVVLRKRLRRAEVSSFFAGVESCLRARSYISSRSRTMHRENTLSVLAFDIPTDPAGSVLISV